MFIKKLLLNVSVICCLLTADIFAQKADSTLVQPLSVYVNWASYDELSDTVRLRESHALQQLEALMRMRNLGARFDYYMMDAFWFDPDGSYRSWRKPEWPQGYKPWIVALQKAGIKPGLWFSVNYLYPAGRYILQARDTAWQSSMSSDGKGLCLFDGGYLNHFMETLDMYAQEGFKMFKFDFFDVYAVTPRWDGKMSRDEVKRANSEALKRALQQFRLRHPGVLLIAYNGFGGNMSNTGMPVEQTIDNSWLDVFHTMYCGDPRPADVPAMNFWRSKDIYSDHMVRYFMANGFPMKNIDNAGFMIGNTGTCYNRDKAAWKGMLLLSLARGGWMNTYYGDFTLLNDDDARWFGKAQSIWYPMQHQGTTSTFGGLPGKAEAYGYVSQHKTGAVLTVVNPSSLHQTIRLPASAFKNQRLLFTDAGYKPRLSGNAITLGPEQMAVIGLGSYADGAMDLGIGEGVNIPSVVKAVQVAFVQSGASLQGSFVPAEKKMIRVVFQQFDQKGIPFRTTGGSPPDGVSLEKMLSIKVVQGGRELPVHIQYNKAIWSGLSWAMAEIDPVQVDSGQPLNLFFATSEKQPLVLRGNVYYVSYQ